MKDFYDINLNIIDLQDIIENKEEDTTTYELWQKAIDDAGYDMEWIAENEPTMIRSSYFTEYAQEMAEDCGLIPRDLTWPLYCIDWDHAALELLNDYSFVEVEGIRYYFRSC